jgi:hypothetical protein
MVGSPRSLILAFCGVLLFAKAATPQVPIFPDEFQRSDVIAIELDDRTLFGFDSVSGARTEMRLEISENVHFIRSRGRVGLVLTNRRAIALGPGTGFREIRYQPSEGYPEVGLVEDQIALIATAHRVLGFVGSAGIWVEERLPPSESTRALRVGRSVGVIATNRRLLGLGVQLRSFVPEDLRVREELESISTQDTLATFRTNKRIFVFGALRGTWTVQDRELD